MTKDYMFIEKKRNYPFWISIVIILILLMVVGKMEKDELLLKQRINKQNYTMVWQINDGMCYNQLMNSNDGIIRIKFNK